MADITIKDYARETRIFHARVAVCTIGAIVLTGVLLLRLLYLQVVSQDHYSTLSQQNRISLAPIQPVRGLIYDRNGQVLAQNFPAYTLEIIPDQVADMEALLGELRQLVQIEQKDLERFYKLRRQRPGFENIVLRARLTEEEAARFAVNRHRLRGAELRARLQRHYPMGALGVHLLGYVGRISDQDLPKIDKTIYRGMDYIGKLGVEASYEDILLGKVGFEQVEMNAHGRGVRMLGRTAAVAGQNLYLTIDAKLQEAAERALAKFQRGAVVAIEPKTGAVLAFASTPTYDPNPFVNGIDEESYRVLRDSPDRPLLNRALLGRYAPGSTIKSFMSLAALEYGRNPDKTTSCPGWFSLPKSGHRYRCWRATGHGSMNLHDAVVQSCDVYFYDLANFLGIDRVHQFLTRFGFGVKTGIDLNDEVDGLIPSVEWKQRARKDVWYAGETVVAGIGQGYTLVTPLQLAAGIATIANHGQRMRPRVVYAQEDPRTKAVQRVEPQTTGLIQLQNPEYYDRVVQALTDVVHSDFGTARGIGYNAKYRIAGKTGTAQVIGVAQGERYVESRVAAHLRDHALFVAFAPVDDPKIAIAVIAENGGHGSSAAAPIARQVMDAWLLGPDGKLKEDAVAPTAGGTP